MSKEKGSKKKDKLSAKELVEKIGKSGIIVGRSSTHWIVRKKSGWATVKRSTTVDTIFSKVFKRQGVGTAVVLENIQAMGGGTDDGGYNVKGKAK